MKIILIFLLITSNVLAADKMFSVKSFREKRLDGLKVQTYDYSCGAAALVILLQRYFNDNRFDESSLLTEITLRLSKEEYKARVEDGFSMLDLKFLAERIGYIADGVKLPKEAATKLKVPVIILLHKSKELRHFVVLRGVTEYSAFIADPLAGNLRIPLHELRSQWRGEALIITREGFGLPEKHKLALNKVEKNSPNEYDTYRALFNTRSMKAADHVH